MSINSHKVGVCIPVYNGEKYINNALNSVLRQDFKDYELIVVDDCSTDASPEIIGQYQKKHKNIKYFRNNRNLGITGNWNRCIELSNGEYIIILHQDDELLLGCLELQVRTLDQHSDAGLVFGNAELLYLPERKQVISPGWGISFKIRGGDFARYFIAHRNLICCPTVMVRKECYEKCGTFDTHFRLLEDYEMWLRLALRGTNFIFLHHILAQYTYHPRNETKRIIAEGCNIKEFNRMINLHQNDLRDLLGNQYEKLLNECNESFAYIWLGYAINLLCNGKNSEARRQLDAAVKLHPLYRDSRIVQIINILTSMGIVGKWGMILIEGALKALKLIGIFEKSTYNRNEGLPKNFTKISI